MHFMDIGIIQGCPNSVLWSLASTCLNIKDIKDDIFMIKNNTP